MLYTVTVWNVPYGIYKKLGNFKTLRGAKCAATRCLNKCWKGTHRTAEILDSRSGKRHTRLQHSAGLDSWQEQYRRY